MAYLGRRRKKSLVDSEGYRPNVGIIICNCDAKLLWARRVRHDGWQFPQGGIEHKESPREAAYRELYEEIGLYPHQVRLLGTSRKWYRYDVPYRPQSGTRFRGQKQQWFLFHLTGKEADICLNRSAKPEFDGWCWVDYWHPIDNIVSFKKDVYREALSEFEPIMASVNINRSGRFDRAKRRID